MATITVTIGGGGHTAGEVKQISVADLQRMLTAYREKYAADVLPPAVPPTLTDDDVVNMWAREVIETMKVTTHNRDQKKAAQDAAAGVPPLEVT